MGETKLEETRQEIESSYFRSGRMVRAAIVTYAADIPYEQSLSMQAEDMDLSTVSHPLEPIRIKHLSVVRKDAPVTAEPSPEDIHLRVDDGLGCMRGLAVAMLCNVILASIIVAGWELWRLLH